MQRWYIFNAVFKLKDFIIALGKELSAESESDTTLAETTVSVM